jgi:tetratricopeptide (TPR) repeat protein
VHFFLGSALALTGKVSAGIEELQRAMELDKGFQPAYRAFGMFRVQQGQFFRDALEALETAVRLDPTDARAQYWLGRFYQRIGDGARARRCYEAAYQQDREDPATRAGLGQMTLADGEVEQALQHFDAALAADPAFVPALLGRARALNNLGRPAEALPAAEAAGKGARGYEDVHGVAWLLCRLYRALGREADAQAAEKRLVEIEDEFAGEMARIRELTDQAARFRATNQLDKLAETLEAFLRVRETGDALIRLGDVYLEMGKKADAERCYLRASEVGPMTDSLKQRLERARAVKR